MQKLINEIRFTICYLSIDIELAAFSNFTCLNKLLCGNDAISTFDIKYDQNFVLDTIYVFKNHFLYCGKRATLKLR